MKKMLISVAVAGAFIAPSAMAEVTTYGLVQAELAQTNWKKETPNVSENNLNLLDNSNGRLGVKAAEDLGNGWKGLAKLEFKIDTVDNNVDSSKCSVTNTVNDPGGTAVGVTVTSKCTASNKVSLSGRESLVGLKGSAGTFEAGTLKQAYKYMGGVKYDAFVATALEARGNGGMSGGALGQGGFHTAALGYSNKFGPVKLRVTYSPQTDNSMKTVGVMYEANGIEAFVATADDGKQNDPAKQTNTKFGGAYKMGGHKVMLQLESIKNDTGTSNTTDKYTYLAYNGGFGKTNLIFQYGAYKPDTGNGKDTTYMALGARFNFSKQTALFGGYRSKTVKDTDTSSNSIISVGLIKKF